MFNIGDIIKVKDYDYDPKDGKDPNGLIGRIIHIASGNMYVVTIPKCPSVGFGTWVFFIDEMDLVESVYGKDV